MKIADGVYVHFIPTQKYKTNRIVFRMTGSLNKQTIAKRALVSQMLATATGSSIEITCCPLKRS